MPDLEAQRSKKVSSSALDEIKKIGMSAALKKYTSGEGGPEFKTAMERYYSPQRLKGSSRAAVASQGKSGGTASENKTPVPMPPSAPAAAKRKAAPKGMAQGLGAPVKSGKGGTKKPSHFAVAVKNKSEGGSRLDGLFKPKLKKASKSERLKKQLERQKAPQSPTTYK